MSRLNSLARTTSVRSSRPRASRSRIELGDRPVDLLLHPLDRGVAVLVRVPVQERHVLGRHLDEARAGLGQPPGEQAAQAEAAGVVLVVALLRLLRQVEGVALLGRRAAGGRCRCARSIDSCWWSLMYSRCGELIDQLLEQLVAVGEAARRHPLRRAHGVGGVVGIRQVERAELAAEEAGGGERLELLRSRRCLRAAGRC